MGLRRSLSSHTELDHVDNVVVFVADSLREDHLPDEIAEAGVTAPTVSASTFTGSSVPSMFTGQYPPTHRVWDFGDGLESRPELFDAVPNSAYEVRDIFRWPVEALRLDSPDTDGRALAGMEQPFLYVLHDKGGHVPYGSSPDDWESTGEFFEHHSDPTELRSLYRRSVERSAAEFLEVLTSLEDRGLLNRTLVVFTSDHGELLGSYGGLFGHGYPIVPEMVRVPTVFLGAGLPEGVQYDHVISGVDLAPTLMGSLGADVGGDVAGVDMWSEEPGDERYPEAYVWKRWRDATVQPEYRAGSMWAEQGGVVLSWGSIVRRLGAALGQYVGAFGGVHRTLSPTDVGRSLRAHLRSRRTFGTPPFTEEMAAETLVAEFHEQRDGGEEEDLTPTVEQLRKLGYR